MVELEKFECGECKCVFIADDRRWHMDYCPKCGNTAVDKETYYCRLIANKAGKFPKSIDTFDPPWFDDREEYHSALLGWVNDSDEEYILFKKDHMLIIHKQ